MEGPLLNKKALRKSFKIEFEQLKELSSFP